MNESAVWHTVSLNSLKAHQQNTDPMSDPGKSDPIKDLNCYSEKILMAITESECMLTTDPNSINHLIPYLSIHTHVYFTCKYSCEEMTLLKRSRFLVM